MIEFVVEAIIAELQRQRDASRAHGIGWLDADNPKAAVIDGQVDLESLARAVIFCPTGDNHHNAAACPYCQGQMPQP